MEALACCSLSSAMQIETNSLVNAPVPVPSERAGQLPSQAKAKNKSLCRSQGSSTKLRATRRVSFGHGGRLESFRMTTCTATPRADSSSPAVMSSPYEAREAQDDTLLVKEKAAEVGYLLQGTSIFLVGMMGSGKTTVGRILAEALGYCFFDSDWVVEQAAGGASVAEIFAENGEEAFRDAESQAIAQLSAMVRLVVATGGGAVMRRTNWGRMRDGVTVWLNVPVEALASRLAAGGTESRPILSSEEEPAQDAYSAALNRLSLIFEERQPLYVPADAEVSLQDMAVELGGVEPSSITPAKIALQVLLEIETLIRRREMEDKARQQA